MEMITHNEIKTIVDKYQRLTGKIKDVEQSFKEFKELNELYKRTSYEEIDGFNKTPYRGYNFYQSLNTGFIQEILQYDKIQNLMTEKNAKELHKNLEVLSRDGNFEISETSAHDLIASLLNNSADIIKNQIKTCYLLMTNVNPFENKEKFKSMKSDKIGTKVILTYKIKDNIADIIKCFNFITAKKIDPYLIPYSPKTGEIYKNEYFNVKVFKNGNAHLNFTDLEALEKFNLQVGKYFNWIKSTISTNW
jgi:hypothetical protein